MIANPAQRVSVAFLLLSLLLPLTAAAKDGRASYYSHTLEGQRTASGHRYDGGKLTAASSNLPLGSKVRVTNKLNGRSVVVLVNDRLRGRGNRIDLSMAAAKWIGMIRHGIVPVRIETATAGKPRAKRKSK